ncbi:DUF4231 domain-containing protein [Hanamia caeni]|jgi:hypothetical protein|uniref:DUF4231 domain-containing protein n=1 Tax=Hanamia caeni TaxID=2294116 RepID=A0A3M9NQQ7_9BACT|nr:DUF4231 domain-containing protein [Hanamia caeni]RNI40151.1 DUF4231 domain-containing protein [Hanamia caeni]
MDKAAFNDYLEKRYYDQLKYYSSASKKNQKRYKNIQWILIILSTVTTILAALPGTDHFDFKYLIVVTAALVTILTSGLKTFQYQELWVSYRSTMEQLKPEIYYYNFGVGDYGKPGADKECIFVSRVEQILSKEHTEWPAVKKLKEQQSQQQQEDPGKANAEPPAGVNQSQEPDVSEQPAAPANP